MGGQPRKGLLLSLDIRKVFDILSWSYLFRILSKWQLDPKFLSFLGTLFSNPLAQIRMRGYTSASLLIASGRRQGCPLSPLYFIIAIETLAVAILSHPNILGVVSGGIQHKSSFFYGFFFSLILTLSQNRLWPCYRELKIFSAWRWIGQRQRHSILIWMGKSF